MGATGSTALNPCCPCLEEDKYHGDLMDGKDAALFPYDLGEILGKGLTSSVYLCKSECGERMLASLGSLPLPRPLPPSLSLPVSPPHHQL